LVGVDGGGRFAISVRWDLDEPEPLKAYPDDEFSAGEDWQLVDFMRKLGLVYPVSDDGELSGITYRFE